MLKSSHDIWMWSISINTRCQWYSDSHQGRRRGRQCRCYGRPGHWSPSRWRARRSQWPQTSPRWWWATPRPCGPSSAPPESIRETTGQREVILDLIQNRTERNGEGAGNWVTTLYYNCRLLYISERSPFPFTYTTILDLIRNVTAKNNEGEGNWVTTLYSESLLQLEKALFLPRTFPSPALSPIF